MTQKVCQKVNFKAKQEVQKTHSDCSMSCFRRSFQHELSSEWAARYNLQCNSWCQLQHTYM